MINLDVMLDTLAGLGVSVTLSETGKIQVHPMSACPGELLTELKNNRDELQLFLEQKQSPVSPVSPFPHPTQEKHPRSHPRPIPVSPSVPDGERGRLPDGYLNVAVLQNHPGRCASCARWQGPDAYGDGLCVLGRQAHGWPYGNPNAPVMTTALHCCAAHGGQGWQAKRSVPAPR